MKHPAQRLNVRDERGDSLIEVLVAVAIIAASLTIILAAVSTGVIAVRTSSRITRATNLATSQLESIKATSYVTGTTNYPAISAGDYTIDQEISYWDGSAFATNPLLDVGMQWITVTVSYQGDPLVVSGNYKVNR